MIGLLIAAALAGWVEVADTQGRDEVVLDVPLGESALIRVHPASAVFTLRADGVDQPMYAGPRGTWVVPPSDRGRVLRLHTDRHVRVEQWAEDDHGDPAAWTRYARDVRRWCHGKALLPPAPGPLEGLDRWWEARRTAMRAEGHDDPQFCTAAAWLELEAVRSRGLDDHLTLASDEVQLEPDAVYRAEAKGPGVFVISAAPVLPDEATFGPVELRVFLDGRLVERVSRRAGPNPERPGTGWRRGTEVVLPPGDHQISVSVLDGPVVLDTRVERLLLPLGRSGVFDALYRELGEVGHLEAAVLTRRPDAWQLAASLRRRPESELADARWIALAPDAKSVSIEHREAIGPLGRAAWARRSAIQRDLDPARLVGEPVDWTERVDDVASLLEQLEPSAVRPRDVWARRLAQAPEPGGATTRWTAIDPLIPGGEIYSPDARGGVLRTKLLPGEQAVVTVEDLSEGLGRLRLMASEPVRYRVDGEARHGLGRLDEAVTAGEHTVMVDQGELWLLDGSTTVGGTRLHEVTVGALPGTWPLPEAGFPARVAISTDLVGAELSVSTDDGRAWTLTTVDGYSVLDVGPNATALYIDGPRTVRASVALERAIEQRERALPDPGLDPLATLDFASQRLVVEPDLDGREEAWLRLNRASALVSLGLSGSARRELSYISSLADISEGQRALAALHLAVGLDADMPGPLTAEAALARVGRLPPNPPSAAAWLAEADALPPELSPPVYERASELLLDEGRPYEAWRAALQGGAAADEAGRAVLRTGRWHRLTRVEQSGGAVRQTLTREGPGPDATAAAKARELMLGAPWAPETYAVLRGGRRDRVVLPRGGGFAAHLLCQDEAVAVGSGPCEVTVLIDEEPVQLRLPQGRLQSFKQQLGPGTHEIVIDSRRDGTKAVVVRLEHDGALLPPQVDVVAHRIGAGVRASVAGPGLLRVQVPRGGPLRVRLGDEEHVVSEESVLLTLDEGAVPLVVTGPPDSWVGLAQWEPRDADEILAPLPPPATYVAPPATSERSIAARDWMAAVRRGLRVDRRLTGPPGTLRFGLSLVDDAIGERDLARHYRATEADVAAVATFAPHWWGEVGATGRASLDGPVAGGLSGRLWRTGDRTWWELGARGWTSLDAGHVRVDGEVLHRLSGRDRTRFDLFGRAWAGSWSELAPTRTDPRAWTDFGANHPVGVAAGGRVTWRPVLDARLRGTVWATSNSDASLDRVEGRLTGNALLGEHTVATASAELGVRFRDRHRAEVNWRPALRANVEWWSWPSASQRFGLRLQGAWLPLGRVVEGGLSLTWDVSRSRGLEDYPVARTLFRDLRDFPEERR